MIKYLATASLLLAGAYLTGSPALAADPGITDTEILIGDVDLKTLEDIRRNWPFLRDRRIDSYAPITNRLLD